ncbi:putative norsolorinic acid reductase [Diplodia seriata]|uniref:Putative norsolorinic acid reductase n=1 Tax=Diplodia seriata TaxID=420778 RepID=A0A0G2HFA2_9PEZI|nr:putative norsolorinic acid reductase [Diplodia seriata]
MADMQAFFQVPPKPTSSLAWHRILSPTASIKVSPVALGGISLGSAWSSYFGQNEDAAALLDTFHSLGGNFIDTSNDYNAGESERLIGEWMEARGVRDQMVVATKFSSGFMRFQRDKVPLHQSNFTGNSAKSLHVSVKQSLKNLRTDYVDILYVHWWDAATSVEELMTHLHALVMARQVLYLGASDMPAWVVVKANAYARQHGYTPFSVYQGRWNAAYRDMEAEVIPMCEDQGMAIVPWGALDGGQLMTAKQREEASKNPEARKGYGQDEKHIRVSEVLERIANAKGVTLQAVVSIHPYTLLSKRSLKPAIQALAYLYQQSTYVVPIVGVQTVEHVRALNDAVEVRLSDDEATAIHEASAFVPLFPVSFLYQSETRPYSTRLGASDVENTRMAGWINAPPKQPPFKPHADM